MSALALIAAAVVCGWSVFRGFQGQTFLGRALGGDYAQFYVAGRILNQHEPARLYDLDLEVALQHKFAPGMSKDHMLVFASAPYLAWIYRPLAGLPYAWSYVAWLIFSFALYAASLLLLLGSVPLSRTQQKTGFLLGISSMPFLMETWIGGQISVLGFFAICLFVYSRSKNLPFLSGLGLALAIFKPTLVALPVLMLLCGRRWRVLSGIASGVAALAVASIAAVGLKGCAAWIDTLRFYGRVATGPAAVLRRFKYVDFGSFFRVLLGDSAGLAQILAIIVCAAGVAVLGIAWWRSSSWNIASRDLLWAATLSASVVLNVYTPIYDALPAAAAAALAAGVFLKRDPEDREALIAWLVLLYLVPWITQSLAEFLRLQLFTLVLAGFAGWALRRASRSEPAGDFAVDRQPEPLAVR